MNARTCLPTRGAACVTATHGPRACARRAHAARSSRAPSDAGAFVTHRSLRALALSTFAATSLLGCPNPQTYGTPRTLEPGKITHTVAMEGWRYSAPASSGKAIEGQIPMPPTYQLRVGVADKVDVGLRLPNMTSVGADVKINPVRSASFDLAIQPGVQWFQLAVHVNDTESKASVYYFHLPVLLGFALSDNSTLTLSPGVTYTTLRGTAASSGAEAASTTKGIWGRFGVGLNVRISPRFALHPEVTVLRAEQTTMAFLGLGFNIGSMPNYGAESRPR